MATRVKSCKDDLLSDKVIFRIRFYDGTLSHMEYRPEYIMCLVLIAKFHYGTIGPDQTFTAIVNSVSARF
jgi:hypothetical protein